GQSPGAVAAHDAAAARHPYLPPLALDVLLERGAEGTVVPRGAGPAVDLTRLEDEATTLRERDDLIEGVGRRHGGAPDDRAAPACAVTRVRNVQPTEPGDARCSPHGAHDRGDVVFGVPEVERGPCASGATGDADAGRRHALELRSAGVGPRHDRLVLLREPELVAQQLAEARGTLPDLGDVEVGEHADRGLGTHPCLPGGRDVEAA